MPDDAVRIENRLHEATTALTDAPAPGPAPPSAPASTVAVARTRHPIAPRCRASARPSWRVDRNRSARSRAGQGQSLPPRASAAVEDGYHLLDSLAVFPRNWRRDDEPSCPATIASCPAPWTGPFGFALAGDRGRTIWFFAPLVLLAAATGAVPARALLTLDQTTARSPPASAAARPMPPPRCGCLSQPMGRAGRSVAGPAAASRRRCAGLSRCLDRHGCAVSAERTSAPAFRHAPAVRASCWSILASAVATVADVFRGRSAGPFSGICGAVDRTNGTDAAAQWRPWLARPTERPGVARDCAACTGPIADVLDEVAARCRACLLERMSGSGATCFGLFADPCRGRVRAASSDFKARGGVVDVGRVAIARSIMPT